MKVAQKEILDAKFNLMGLLDIIYGQDEIDYDKAEEIQTLLSKLNYGIYNKDDWAKIQEYVIAREMIRDRAVANCEQNCFIENDNNFRG